MALKNARRIARKPTLTGLGQLGSHSATAYAINDPDHHDVFPGGRAGTVHGHPASRHPWTFPNHGWRVHYYDAKRGGTRHQYFETYDDARTFAMPRTLHARPCIVEVRPS